MQTYWDHSEKERAEMARAEVEKFLDAELMHKGVLKVPEPQYEPVPDMPETKPQTWYKLESKDHEYHYGRKVTQFAFSKIEAAHEFLALKPQYIKDTEPMHLEGLPEVSVVPVEVLTEPEYQRVRVAVEARKAVKNDNDTKRKEFNSAAGEVTKVLHHVWNDWTECREKRAKHKKVLDTLAEYRRIAEDNAVAMQFLRKAFDDKIIEEAYEWLGQVCPLDAAQEKVAAAEIGRPADNWDGG